MQLPDVPLPAHTLPPSGGGFAYEGRLRETAGCLWLDDGAAGLNLLWPAGYRLRSDPVAVISDQGEVVARIGDEVFLDGAPIENALVLPGCALRRGAAIAQIVEVNGVRVSPTDNLAPRDPRPVR